MPETPSDARFDMSKARLVNVPYSPSPPDPTMTTSAVGIARPLSVTRLKPGPNPRAVTREPSPLTRSIETPVIRCRDSARFVSGNLPMSSALIASTTPTASRFISIEAFRLPRNPVTTTSSSSEPDWSWANAGAPPNNIAPPTAPNRACWLLRFSTLLIAYLRSDPDGFRSRSTGLILDIFLLPSLVLQPLTAPSLSGEPMTFPPRTGWRRRTASPFA